MEHESHLGISGVCTILVPLKDNVHRTKHFLKHNDFSQFHFIFADGSLGDENEKLFASVRRPHISYVRFPADVTLATYLDKMAAAAQLITTPFTMQMDAGDYLLPKGVEAAIASLLKDRSAATAGGKQYSTREIGKFMSRPQFGNPTSPISDKSFHSALEAIKSNYCYLWYAVHRSEVFKKTWTTMANEKFQHPYMEYFPTLSALASGHYVDTGIPFLLRVVHGPRSWTKQPSDLNLNQDEMTVNQGTRLFADRCAALLGLDSDYVFQTFEKNAAEVIRSSSRRTIGPKWFARLMPSEFVVKKVPFLGNLERVIGHYAGWFLHPGTEKGFRSILQWSTRTSRLRELGRPNI